jgi:hypothetical protein
VSTYYQENRTITVEGSRYTNFRRHLKK